MTLKIISTEDILFEGEVTSVTLPGEKGEFMVLKNHASLISSLLAGNICYVQDGNEVAIPVAGGIVSVDRNIISVCIY